jgi:protein AroM
MHIGFVTVGESPRDDLIPAYLAHLPADTKVSQRGVMDGLTSTEIAELAARCDEPFLLSRMRDERIIKTSTERVLQRVQQIVMGFDERIDIDFIVLLCTGSFKSVRSTKPLIKPDELVKSLIASIAAWTQVGVISPDPGQFTAVRERWGDVCDIRHAAANPYDWTEPELRQCARGLKDCALLILAGQAYSRRAKELAMEETLRPVLLPQEIVAHTLRCLV